MGFKCGIVGLPNVGKSTLFNALTKAGIAAANYPFCTIEPNVGVVALPDKRLDEIAKIIKPRQIIPTTTCFVDIAGLVAGASKGEGLGNQFLSHIRETQAIAQVVRCFINDDIIYVRGEIDPLADIEVINTELILADLDTVTKCLAKVAKHTKSGNKDALLEKELLENIFAHLDKGQLVSSLSLDEAHKQLLSSFNLLTAKPMLYIANVSEDGFSNNPYLTRLQEFAAAENNKVVTICASLEAEIAELADSEKYEFLASMGLNEPGLDRLIHAGYELLGLQTFFTAGVKEVRAWTIYKGVTAPEAAGVIHSDFTKGFIRAEVIGYDDFINYHGELGAKEAGKWRLEGKDYVVADGDILHFRFNV